MLKNKHDGISTNLLRREMADVMTTSNTILCCDVNAGRRVYLER